MTLLRRVILLTNALLAASLIACSGEDVTGAAPEVQMTDAQRAVVAQGLVAATEESGDGSLAAHFAAAAIVAGAEVRTVQANQISAALTTSAARAVVPAGARGSLATTASASAYFAVATQVAEGDSPDVLSIIVAWRQGSDGTPTDFVVTLAGGAGSASFAPVGDEPPGAFALIHAAPSALWRATAGTTSLERASTGDACRNIDQRLAASGLRGTCRLALFDAGVDVAASTPAATTGNTAQGSAVFSLGASRIGGVLITITGLAEPPTT